jgi:outer membrane protein assembly factor BamD
MMTIGNWDRAIADFTELRNYHRDDPLSVRAQLALAEIHFRKREYEEARYAFEEFATYHPRHPDMDYVVYKSGMSTWRQAPTLVGRDQSLTRAAVNRWSGFATRFPESQYKEEVARYVQRGVDRLARKELTVARFYARREAWAGVVGRAAEVVQRYPQSTLNEDALAYLARAYQATGRVDDARAARERLEQLFPESHELHVVDRALAKPPGTPPEEVIFARPYRRGGFGQTVTPGR